MRRGFTLIELLVVISIISILASLLLPTITTIREKARIQETGNNIRRIVEAQISYSSDAGLWAYPAGAPVPDGGGSDDAAINPSNNEFVGRIFVLLAKANELSHKLFINNNATVRPSPDYAVHTATYNDIAGISGGQTRAPLDTDEAMRWSYSFAYDWSAPQNSATGRPVIGDRDPSIWGGKGACVAYGDGHFEFKPAFPTSNADVPLGQTVVPINFVSRTMSILGDNVRSMDNGVADWIYTHQPEEGEKYAWRVGRGSSTLAWLR